MKIGLVAIPPHFRSGNAHQAFCLAVLQKSMRDSDDTLAVPGAWYVENYHASRLEMSLFMITFQGGGSHKIAVQEEIKRVKQ